MRTRDDATRRCAQIVTARKTSYRYRWRLGDAFVDYGDALPSDRSSPSRVKAILGALRRRERQQRRLERLCRHPRASQSFLRGGFARRDPTRPSAPNLLLAAAAAAAAAARARASNAAGPPRVVRDVEVRRLATASANGHPGSGLLGFESRRRERPTVYVSASSSFRRGDGLDARGEPIDEPRRRDAGEMRGTRRDDVVVVAFERGGSDAFDAAAPRTARRVRRASNRPPPGFLLAL